MSDQTIRMQLQLARGNFALDVNLALPEKSTTVLFGRSGCGKTSLLRSVAGLEKATGTLSFRNSTWQDDKIFLPTHKRPLAYVFQEASLFSHLDVRGNLLFGYQRIPVAERRIGFDDAVQLLGVEKLLTRRPETLSGGERQRVAIVRALLTSPQWLLMDEPLANLDAESKADILPFIERLRHELAIPLLYVTHAADEMARLADFLVLMEDGRVRASAAPNVLLTNPDLPLARLDDAAAVLEGAIVSHDDVYQLSTVKVLEHMLVTTRSSLSVGQTTHVRILARDVSIALTPPANSSILNCLAARVLDITPDAHPSRVLVRLALDQSASDKNTSASTCLLSRITRRSADQLALSPGMAVCAQVKAVALLS